MARVESSQGINLQSIFVNFSKAFNGKVNREAKSHLKNVYGCLTLGLLAATVGAYLHLTSALFQSGLIMILSSLTAIGSLLYIFWTKAENLSAQDKQKRMGAFAIFTFCSGLGLGPLLEMALVLDPSIIVTALMMTTLLFVSFTLAAIFAREGQWIYIGGTLMTMLSALITMSFANMFLGSKLLFDASLYLGLFVMCGFILYDTQLIMEKFKSGDKDYVSHSVDLFIDFIGVFRRVLMILANKESEKKKNSKDQ